MHEKDLIFVRVYVNDLLLGSRSYMALEWLKDQLIKEFQIKDLAKAKTIIEWEITRDIKVGMLKIDSKKYIQDLLKAEKMISCHTIILPIKVELVIFMVKLVITSPPILQHINDL